MFGLHPTRLRLPSKASPNVVLRQIVRYALLAVAGACLLAPLAPMPTSAQDKLLTFADIEGTWKGFGWFVFTAGNKKRARCTAIIRQDGGPERGSLDLNCTAQAMEINARAFSILLTGNAATGAWSIPSFKVEGVLRGKITHDSLTAHLQPSGDMNADYGATLKAQLQPGKCRVAIQQQINSPLDLKALDLNLRRC